MTEKKTAEKILRQSKTAAEILRLKYADDKWEPIFSNIVAAMEEYAAQQNPDLGGNVKKFAAQQKSEIPTDDRIMQYVTSRFSDSHLKPELIAFRAIKYYIAGLPPVSENRCVLDGQKSEIKMPPKEAIVQYFNNHFNCHADVIIGDYETTETAMTVDAVLKMIEWLRNQITER